MKRREFVAGLAGSAAWHGLAKAQPHSPTIGFLNSRSFAESKALLGSFEKGLAEAGYSAGKNAVIEYRWSGGRYDELPALAKDLVARQVAVIVAGGGPASPIAAKNATSTIPIVFVGGSDPVRTGLVSNLSRP